MNNNILELIQNKERGSIWCKWDLHFHTPSSYDYKDKSISNEQIIDGLLKENISVVAITDHNIIDIERINSLKSIANDSLTILPGIEFCSEMRGDDPIHFIGIFSENADINYIWNEINTKAEIATQKKNGKKENEIYCDLKDTIKLIKKLDGIVTIHAGSKSNSIENITNTLPVKMAQKKDISDVIDFFELGNVNDIIDYENIVFPAIGSVFPMIIGSDNHNINSYKFKEYCWMKAKPTFAGLNQILLEKRNRIFIGKLPPILEEVNKNPVKYIESISIKQIDGYDGKNGVWFDNITIPFNPELNIVIGNKGSGKSSISDSIGLLGDSENDKHFSFLVPKKFLKRGYGENFLGTLEWFATQKNASKHLNKPIDRNTIPKITYLPQSYFENLCNDLEGSNFEEELQSVIFKRLRDEDKFNAKTFDQLIDFKTKSISDELQRELDKLHELNQGISSLENKLHSNYISRLTHQIDTLDKEINSHNQTKPKDVQNPTNDTKTEESQREIQTRVNKIELEIVEIERLIEEKGERLKGISIEKVQLSHFISRVKQLQVDVKETSREYENVIKKFHTEGDFLTLTYEQEVISKYIEELDKELVELQVKLSTNEEDICEKALESRTRKSIHQLVEESLIIKKESLINDKTKLTTELSAPFKLFEKYKQDLKDWETRLLELVGDQKNPSNGTKSFFESERKYLNEQAKNDLESLRAERREISTKVYSLRYKIIEVFDDLKTSISTVINGNEKLLKLYNVEVIASFRYKYDFFNVLSDLINMNVSGYFYRDSDNKKINELFKEIDLSSFETINTVNESFISKLENSSGKNEGCHIHDQIKEPVKLYDYLFGFGHLEERYELTLNEKPLEVLSPGERGALLLVFYLMIDEEVCPLVIDQPEDNLDNKSVYEILVHFIREAKVKRQIILVTHSPNLAVGADAENIIYVDIDKLNQNMFSFFNGAIEDKSINQKLVDILEGTMPAFNLRKLKYIYN